MTSAMVWRYQLTRRSVTRPTLYDSFWDPPPASASSYDLSSYVHPVGIHSERLIGAPRMYGTIPAFTPLAIKERLLTSFSRACESDSWGIWPGDRRRHTSTDVTSLSKVSPRNSRRS